MSNDSGVHRAVGEHDATLDFLVRGQAKIFERLDSIDRTLNIREGERRGIKIMFAGLSVVGGLLGAKLSALFK
jgi:hypothetical protein